MDHPDRVDATATVVVTVSMFPAVSVAVGRLFFGDVASRQQMLGLLLALAGVGTVLGT